jgi:hypothetical protein
VLARERLQALSWVNPLTGRPGACGPPNPKGGPRRTPTPSVPRPTGPAHRDCCPDPRTQRHRHGGLIHRIDGTNAFGPVWNWSDTGIWTYLDIRRLPVNPVYARLARLDAPPHAHRVPHLFDGHRVTDGRLAVLRGWPTLFDELATALPRIREYA